MADKNNINYTIDGTVVIEAKSIDELQQNVQAQLDLAAKAKALENVKEAEQRAKAEGKPFDSKAVLAEVTDAYRAAAVKAARRFIDEATGLRHQKQIRMLTASSSAEDKKANREWAKRGATEASLVKSFNEIEKQIRSLGKESGYSLSANLDKENGGEINLHYAAIDNLDRNNSAKMSKAIKESPISFNISIGSSLTTTDTGHSTYANRSYLVTDEGNKAMTLGTPEAIAYKILQHLKENSKFRTDIKNRTNDSLVSKEISDQVREVTKVRVSSASAAEDARKGKYTGTQKEADAYVRSSVLSIFPLIEQVMKDPALKYPLRNANLPKNKVWKDLTNGEKDRVYKSEAKDLATLMNGMSVASDPEKYRERWLKEFGKKYKLNSDQIDKLNAYTQPFKNIRGNPGIANESSVGNFEIWTVNPATIDYGLMNEAERNGVQNLNVAKLSKAPEAKVVKATGKKIGGSGMTTAELAKVYNPNNKKAYVNTAYVTNTDVLKEEKARGWQYGAGLSEGGTIIIDGLAQQILVEEEHNKKIAKKDIEDEVARLKKKNKNLSDDEYNRLAIKRLLGLKMADDSILKVAENADDINFVDVDYTSHRKVGQGDKVLGTARETISATADKDFFLSVLKQLGISEEEAKRIGKFSYYSPNVSLNDVTKLFGGYGRYVIDTALTEIGKTPDEMLDLIKKHLPPELASKVHWDAKLQQFVFSGVDLKAFAVKKAKEVLEKNGVKATKANLEPEAIKQFNDLIVNWGNLAVDTGVSKKNVYSVKDGQLLVDMKHFITRDELGVIDQPSGSHDVADAKAKEDYRTSQGFINTVSSASAANKKDYSLLIGALQWFGNRTQIPEAERNRMEENYNKTLKANGAAANNTLPAGITPVNIADVASGLDLTRDATGLITQESFMNSGLRKLYEAGKDGKPVYIDTGTTHRYFAVPDMSGIKFEKNAAGEMVLSDGAEYLTPLLSAIGSLNNATTGDRVTDIVTNFSKEWGDILHNKDSAVYQRMHKAEAASSAFLKSININPEMFRDLSQDSYLNNAASGAVMNVIDLEKMLLKRGAGESDDQLTKRLEAAFKQQMNGLNNAWLTKQAMNDMAAQAKKAAQSKKGGAAYRKWLAKRIAHSGMAGDKFFNKNGIVANILRYPESMSYLEKASSIFTSNGGPGGVESGLIALGPALQEAQHADFDGDKIRAEFRSALLAAGVPKNKVGELDQQMAEVMEYSRKEMAEVGAGKMAELDEIDPNTGKLKGEDANGNRIATVASAIIKTILNPDEQRQLGLYMKYAKADTGINSFQFQRVEQALAKLGLSETILGPNSTKEDEETVANSKLVKAIFEGKTQGMISAKKIQRLLTAKGFSQGKYVKEAAKLNEAWKNPDSWATHETRHKLLTSAVKLGVLGGPDSSDILAGRNSKLLAGTLLAIDPSGQVLAGVLGLNLNNADDLKKFEAMKKNGEWKFSLKNAEAALDVTAEKMKGRSVTTDSGTYNLGDNPFTAVQRITDLAPGASHTTDAALARHGLETVVSGGQGLIEAAQALKDAARELSSVAGGNAAGSFGFGGHSKEAEVSFHLTPKQQEEYLESFKNIPGTTVPKNGTRKISVSRLLSTLGDFSPSLDAEGFYQSIKNGDFDKYDDATKEYIAKQLYASAQGNVSGAAVQAYHALNALGIQGVSAPQSVADAEKLFQQIGTWEKSGNKAQREAWKLFYKKTTFTDEQGDHTEAGDFQKNYDVLEKIFEILKNDVDKNGNLIDREKITDNRIKGQIEQTKNLLHLGDDGTVYLGSEIQHFLHAGNKDVMGRTDLESFSEKTIDKNKKVKTLTLVDTKNPNSALSAANIAQQLYLQAAAMQESEIIKNFDKQYSGSKKGEWAAFKKENADFVAATGMDAKRFRAYRDFDKLETLISAINDKGEKIVYKITGNKQQIQAAIQAYNDLFDAAGRGDLGNITGFTKKLATQLTSIADISKDDAAAIADKAAHDATSSSRGGTFTAEGREYKQALRQSNDYDLAIQSAEKKMALSIYPSEREELKLYIDDLYDEKDAIDSLLPNLENLAAQTGENTDAIKNGEASRKKLKEDLISIRDKGANTIWGQLANSFRGMLANFTTMGAAYRLIGQVRQRIQKFVSYAAQLDKVMTNLRIVTGDNYDQVRTLTAGYAKLANQLSVTTTEVASSANEWLRQGYSVSETNGLISASMKLSTLGMMSSTDATKALTSAMKGFGIAANDAMSIVDKFTNLDMNAATSAGNIATALSRFATTAKQSGVNIDEAAAMATTIMDVSQDDAGSVGSALKTIFSRYGNVKAGAYTSMSSGNSDDTTEKINDVEKVLNTLGIQVRSSSKDMRSFSDVLDDVAAKWDTLDAVSKNAISTAMAGTRQREAFNVLMENYDKYKELIGVSKNSEGTADKKYLSYTEQLEASQKRLQSAWEEIATNSEITQWISTINDMLTGIVKVLPIIIRYVTRLALALNSYKIPTALNAIFYSLFGTSAKALSGRKIKSLMATGKTWLSRLTAKGQVAAMAGYAPGGTASAGGSAIGRKVAAKANDSGAINMAPGIESQPAATYGFNNLKQGTNYTAAQGTGVTLTSVPAGYPSTAQTGILPQKQPRVTTGQRVMNGAVGAITGFTSATQTERNWSTGEDQQMSTAAGWASRAVTAAGGALGLINPLLGVLGTFLGDVLSQFVIGPLIDRDKNEREERVKEAEKVVSVMEDISNSVSDLKNYAQKDTLTAEDYSKLSEDIYNILDKMYGTGSDEKSRKQFEEYVQKALGTDESLQQILLRVLNSNDREEREKVIKALQAGQNVVSAQAAYDASENDRYEKGQKLKNNGLFSGRNYAAKWWSDDENERGKSFDTLYELFKQEGFNVGRRTDFDLGGPTYSYDFRDVQNKSPEEQLEAINKAIAALYNQEGGYNSDVMDQLQEYRDNLNTIISEQKLYNSKMDKANALAAYEQAKVGDQYLSDMSLRQLKNLGPDELRRIIAQQMGTTANGKSVFDSDGNLTAEAEEAVTAVMKGDTKLNSILNGQVYKIRDVNKMPEGKTKDNLIKSFANALNMTEEDFRAQLADSGSQILSTLGDISLHDALETPAEVRNELESLGDLFKAMGTSTGLTAENIEEIIDKYPELLKYVGDTASLTDALLNNYEGYTNLYAKRIYDKAATSTDVFDSYSSNVLGGLSKTEQNALSSDEIFGNATQLKDILPLLTNNGESLIGRLLSKGLTQKEAEEVRDKMEKEYKDLFDGIDIKKYFNQKIAESYSEYVQKVLEKQLDNLKDQKEALENINNQREYEIKLMEAKQKLENAQKGKKRVWRNGVGWVYEADQSAVKEAQENLNNVTNEKATSELQAQIDILQAQKEYLANLPDETAFENMSKEFKKWAEEKGVTSIPTALQEIADLYKGTGKYAKSGDGDVPDEANNAVNKAKPAHVVDEKWSKMSYRDVTKALKGQKNAIDTYSGDKNSDEFKEMVADYNDGVKVARDMVEKAAWSYYSSRMGIDLSQYGYSEEGYRKAVKDRLLQSPLSGLFGSSESTLDSLVDNDVNMALSFVKEYMDKHLHFKSYNDKGEVNTAANGSLSMPGGASLINELGTEAIITPSGTITALPSGTGVVPADITKNLWALGEQAPLISRSLMTSSVNNSDDSLQIGQFSMNVYPSGNFDIDRWVQQVKSAVSLTKNRK